MKRFDATFLALVLVQGAHSIEEYFGRLWDVFPPAIFVTGLVSDDRRLGFVVLNVTFFLFGLWVLLWPVRHRWQSARFFVGIWIAIEIANGIVHPFWAIYLRDYAPGVITAPFLLIVAIALLRQLKDFDVRPGGRSVQQ